MNLANRLLDEAIYSVLNGNLSSGASVYNGSAPQSASRPYVVIGEDISNRIGDKQDTNGQDIDHTVHVFTSYGSGFKQCKDIMDDVTALITAGSYSLTGFDLWAGYPRLVFQDTLNDRLGDNSIQHGVLRFRFPTIDT